MLRASLGFDLCYRSEFGDYDPSCADGYSSPVPLTVPRPMARYSASVIVYRYSKQAHLRLAVRPLGDTLRYRVCYRLVTKHRRCLSGSVDGYNPDRVHSAACSADDVHVARGLAHGRDEARARALTGKVQSSRTVL